MGEQKIFCEDLESNPTVRILARIRKQTNKISVSFDTGLCGPCYCAGRYVGSVPVCMIQVSPFSTEGKESHIHTSRACVPGFRLGCPGEHHGTMPCSPLISDRGFPCGLPSNEILLNASIQGCSQVPRAPHESLPLARLASPSLCTPRDSVKLGGTRQSSPAMVTNRAGTTAIPQPPATVTLINFRKLRTF